MLAAASLPNQPPVKSRPSTGLSGTVTGLPARSLVRKWGMGVEVTENGVRPMAAMSGSTLRGAAMMTWCPALRAAVARGVMP